MEKALKSESGNLKVAPEVAEYYTAMQRENKFRWVIFKTSDDEKQLVVDQYGAPDSTYTSLLDALPAQHPRWVLINFAYRTARGPNSKLMFVMWVPDSIQRPTLKEAARVKSTGVLWSAYLKPIFKAVSGNIQANDKGDMEWTNVLSKASRFELDPVDTTWRPPQDL